MCIEFKRLPDSVKRTLIGAFGATASEREVLSLKYIDGLSYAQIAARMCVSQSSVGNMLARARRHACDSAKELYPIAPEPIKGYIEAVGWHELEWPVITNRRSSR